MAHSTRPDTDIEAQAAVQKAMNGELPAFGTYSLQQSANGRYSITVPPAAPRGLPASKGDDLPVHIDFQNGYIVYNLSGGEHGDKC
ncbi:hypothetical protein [Haloplanus sp. C73]|uniref:hypothetical protein n=1 Tax=Haloplanus sp. C73 TaxID=3421641 RepID=UPI003EBE6C12